MRAFFVLFCLLPTILWGQCEVYITPGSSTIIDHDPGISFIFEVQKNNNFKIQGNTEPQA